jgi:hypothetical protein
MFEKKLSNEDLEELRKRTELANQHILIAQALELQKQIYIKNLLPKYRCDMNKNYNIDLRSGQIKEVKEKPQLPK